MGKRKVAWISKYWGPILMGVVLIVFIIFVDIYRLSWAQLCAQFLKRQAIALSAVAAFTLAYAAVWSVRTSTDQTSKMIAENRRIRYEDRELDSKRRRLDEVQQWINEVLKLKARNEVLLRGGAEDSSQIKTEARIMVSNKEYIQNEAKLLDSEFKPTADFENSIKRLIYIIQFELPKGFKNKSMNLELEGHCSKVLKHISIIKDALKL